MEMMTRYMAHPEREGLNLETVQKAADSKIKSMRVDQNYRAIAFEQGDTVMFVHVNEHDKAYKWAEGRSVKLDHATNRIRIVREIEQVEVTVEGSLQAKAPGIFDDINDKRFCDSESHPKNCLSFAHLPRSRRLKRLKASWTH